MDEGGGLENRYTGDCIVGSNPTPSAILQLISLVYWGLGLERQSKIACILSHNPGDG